MRYIIGISALATIVPRIAWHTFVAMLRDQQIRWFVKEYAGRGGVRIKHRTLMVGNVALPDFDTWLHYLRKSIDLVGPAPIAFNTPGITAATKERMAVAPGIINPYTVKSRSGIAHQTEVEVSLAFVREATSARRLQLICVHLTQKLFGIKKAMTENLGSFNLFGVRLANISMADAINHIMAGLNDCSGQQRRFAFVNADCANQYYQDQQYRNELNSFDKVFADGIGVKIAARWQGVTLTHNVNGTDMFPLLCERLERTGHRLYLLGAKEAVLEKLVQNLRRRYPDLQIAGRCNGFTHQNNPQALLDDINKVRPDLILVAMGVPRQERWIAQNLPMLNTRVAIGVGGLFDFYSGKVSRAPEWLRELSLEWVWRLAVQPLDKGKRYLIGNPLFLVRAFRASMSA